MTELPISRSGVGGSFASRQAGRRVLVGAAGVRPDRRRFSPFLMYSAFSFEFSDGGKQNAKT